MASLESSLISTFLKPEEEETLLKLYSIFDSLGLDDILQVLRKHHGNLDASVDELIDFEPIASPSKSIEAVEQRELIEFEPPPAEPLIRYSQLEDTQGVCDVDDEFVLVMKKKNEEPILEALKEQLTQSEITRVLDGQEIDTQEEVPEELAAAAKILDAQLALEQIQLQDEESDSYSWSSSSLEAHKFQVLPSVPTTPLKFSIEESGLFEDNLEFKKQFQKEQRRRIKKERKALKRAEKQRRQALKLEKRELKSKRALDHHRNKSALSRSTSPVKTEQCSQTIPSLPLYFPNIILPVQEQPDEESLTIRYEQRIKYLEETNAKIEEEKRNAMRWCLSQMETLANQVKEKDQVIESLNAEIKRFQLQPSVAVEKKEEREQVPETNENIQPNKPTPPEQDFPSLLDPESFDKLVAAGQETFSTSKDKILLLLKNIEEKFNSVFGEPVTKDDSKSIEKETQTPTQTLPPNFTEEDRQILLLEKASLESYTKELEARLKKFEEAERVKIASLAGQPSPSRTYHRSTPISIPTYSAPSFGVPSWLNP